MLCETCMWFNERGHGKKGWCRIQDEFIDRSQLCDELVENLALYEDEEE